MSKQNKNIFFYHPTTINCDIDFSEFVSWFAMLSQNARTYRLDSDCNIVIDIERRAEVFIITLYKLKNNELPKVANEMDGSEEVNLLMPQCKALSFKNIFIYRPKGNILATARLGGCPGVSTLKTSLMWIAKANSSDIKLRFDMIFRRDLSRVLRNANTITMVDIRADELCGEDIDLERSKLYHEYIGGRSYVKSTKLKAKKDENLKNIVINILEDIIANGQPPDGVSVKMTIDGRDINFEKYCEKQIISVETERQNGKYLDYDNLIEKMLQVVVSYREDNEKHW